MKKLEIVIACVWISSIALLGGTAIAQAPMATVPIPYSAPIQPSPFKGIPADPPGTLDANSQSNRLPSGYTQEQLDNLQNAGLIRVYPDGTVESVPPTADAVMAGAAKNAPYPQPQPGWNSPGDVSSGPAAVVTPDVGAGEVRRPHPIKPNSD